MCDEVRTYSGPCSAEAPGCRSLRGDALLREAECIAEREQCTENGKGKTCCVDHIDEQYRFSRDDSSRDKIGLKDTKAGQRLYRPAKRGKVKVSAHA